MGQKYPVQKEPKRHSPRKPLDAEQGKRQAKEHLVKFVEKLIRQNELERASHVVKLLDLSEEELERFRPAVLKALESFINSGRNPKVIPYITSAFHIPEEDLNAGSLNVRRD